MVLCLVSEVLLLTGLAGLFMNRLAKMPPLALLQGDAVRTRGKKTGKKTVRNVVDEAAQMPQFTLSFSISRDLPKGGNYSPVKHVSRYVLRHMSRAGWRTVMAVLLAFLLTGAMGLLAVTRLSYQELFDKTEVKGTLITIRRGLLWKRQNRSLWRISTTAAVTGSFSMTYLRKTALCWWLPMISTH